MKYILATIIICTSAFADYASFERPNLSLGREESKELLMSIDNRIEEISMEFSSVKSILTESEKINLVLNTINDNIVDLIRLTQKSGELLEHLIWIQDHRLAEVTPKKIR